MMAERFRRFFGWIALAYISVLFIGFLPGRISKRLRGKGGGLMGSLVALAVQFLLLDPSNKETLVIMTSASYLLGWLLVPLGEHYLFLRYGSQKRHTGDIVACDYNQTCIDEFHGQLLAGLFLWFLPGIDHIWRIVLLLTSFILFRIYDSKKPWVIGSFERANEGTSFGIMFDDVLAAMFATGTISLFFCACWFFQ